MLKKLLPSLVILPLTFSLIYWNFPIVVLTLLLIALIYQQKKNKGLSILFLALLGISTFFHVTVPYTILLSMTYLGLIVWQHFGEMGKRVYLITMSSLFSLVLGGLLFTYFQHTAHFPYIHELVEERVPMTDEILERRARRAMYRASDVFRENEDVINMKVIPSTTASGHLEFWFTNEELAFEHGVIIDSFTGDVVLQVR